MCERFELGRFYLVGLTALQTAELKMTFAAIVVYACWKYAVVLFAEKPAV